MEDVVAVDRISARCLLPKSPTYHALGYVGFVVFEIGMVALGRCATYSF